MNAQDPMPHSMPQPDKSDSTMSPLKRAFLALAEAEAKLAAMQEAAREPIAVIGLSCRTPGGGHSAESFWQLLRDGVDGIGPIPPERWDVDALYDPDPEKPGRIATRNGGFLSSVDQFDPAFFSIAPREAQGMDPQQRLLLEVCFEALEHAGAASDRLDGSPTGVFMGVCNSDYTYLQLRAGDPTLLDAHFTSGIAHSIVTGRLSYLLGLQGPSLTIDTACSSSLVAVHLACQSLRAGESRMALAGGVNLILSPDMYVALSRARMLAPDGRCKTFDASADGFARGEGCGVVVLKRLSDAQADGDRVLAVIRGSAVNQDGASSSLTAPNGTAQEAVIRAALDRAGLTPNDVGYVEAHGTATQLGDPLEMRALGAVFGPARPADAPLTVGSVKSNIGHLESAAGVVGLIKVVLALAHRSIPGNLHFSNPSPHIPWDELPVRVPRQAAEWKPISGQRIGGVSSFGFSGTNAHVVLQEAPQPVPVSEAVTGHARLLALSAKDPAALAVLARDYATRIAGRSEDELADICYTASVGRAHFPHRATLVARTADEFAAGLAALANGKDAPGVVTAHVARRDPPRIAFLFTGQGAQYAGMARALYRDSAVFRDALDRCAALLERHLDRPLIDLLFAEDGDATRLDQTGYTQPALFAVEYALAELWRSFGVTPNIVAGHSVGEYVAACIAGVFSLEDALALIAKRGALMQSLPAGGAMAAVFAPEDRVAPALASYAGRVAVAGVNGPAQTVISGHAADVEAICRKLATDGIRCQSLPVSHAFHSPLVDPVLDAFERTVAGVELAAPRLRLVSNLTGRLATAQDVTQPAYWRRHMREAVRFGDCLSTIAEARVDCVIEIGPHPTLLSFAGAVFGERPCAFVSSLRKGRDDWQQMLESVAAVYRCGARIDWRGVAQQRRRIVDLPTYPFQRQRYWFKAKPQRVAAAVGADAARHPLLGARLRTASAETIHDARLAADAPAFVRDHRVAGRIALPATAYLDMLLAAGAARLGGEALCIENVVIREAMLLDDDGGERVVQTLCGTPRAGVADVSISSSADEDDGAWTQHVTANVRAGAALPDGPALTQLRAQCPEPVAPADHYADLARRGIEFGAAFHVVKQLWRGGARALGEIAVDDAGDTSAYHMHPLLLDGCLQVIAAALPLADDPDAIYLPIGIGRYALTRRPGTRCISHVAIRSATGDACVADVLLFDETGALFGALDAVELKRVTRDALARLGTRARTSATQWLDDSLYRIAWRAAPPVPVKALPLPEPALLAKAGAAQLDTLRSTARLADYDAMHGRLEALCVDYVVQAMRDLGWRPAIDDAVSADVLAAKLRVLPRHRRLFGRLLAILGEAGHLAPQGDGWRVARAFDEPSAAPSERLALLIADAPPGAAAEVELTGRVAGELAASLRGDCDPMQLLFPGGSTETAEALYRDAPTAQVFNGLMAEIVAQAAAAAREGRLLRILEIGAGTGGTTARVVPRLPREGVEYTFTDIGPAFVARARERFADHPAMRFAVLDLEREPGEQGLADQRFDIVIAANVIHATADLQRTLARVRQFLMPGGLLAMLEVTAPQRWFDLTVGLTEGWWAFTDTALRPDYATLPRERWLHLLPQCGFDAVAALPEGEQQGALALQSLFLARADTRVVRQAPRHWLILADRAGVSAALAAHLRAAGDRVTLSSDADIRRELAEPVSGVIDARALDIADGDAAAQTVAVGALDLAQALAAQAEPPRLWFVTRGAQMADADDRAVSAATAPLWGLAKTLTLEHPELKCVCIDLDPVETTAGLDLLAAELDADGTETQVAHRKEERRVARLTRRPAADDTYNNVSATPWRLVPAVPGVLDRFDHQPLPRRVPGAGEVEIAVEATGLNFKDVLNVLGLYPGDPGPLGGECAGTVTAVGPGVAHVKPGDTVMAVAGGSFASHVTARAELVQPCPAGMSAAEAAAFPIAFLTAAFCLSHLAGLRAGERVLIHAGAGGVGMAAIRLAQRAGAEIFATAGAPWKRDLLHAMGVAHVLDSRSDGFADAILAATGGCGVDVVLNSLAGSTIDASFRALAPGGRFVEIGKRDIKTPQWVEALDRGIRYFIVDWGDTAAREPELIGGLFARLSADLRSGALVSLPRQVFPLADAASAFRLMAQAGHAGKVVVAHSLRNATPVRRDGTYLVTGGLSGLGLLTVRWLAEQGAGRVVAIGRRAPTPENAAALAALAANGTTIVTEQLDVTDAAALRALLQRLRADGPPLRGIVHSAGRLDDAALMQQNAARFAHVLGPKVTGGALLDALTRGDPLDWFVFYSSIAAVLGSPGQANHSAANAFLDALAQRRRCEGRPAQSINWGGWSEIGAAADRAVIERLAQQGLGALSPDQGIAALTRLLHDNDAQTVVLPADWTRYLAQGVSPARKAFLAELIDEAPRAAPTAAPAKPSPAASSAASPAENLAATLAAAPEARKRTLLATFIRERALQTLGLDVGRAVDPRTPLGELGLDSLLSVELRNRLSVVVGKPLPATLLFDHPTLDALTDHLCGVLGLDGHAAARRDEGMAQQPSPGLVEAIEDLSDDDVERLYAARLQARSAT